MIQRIQSVYLAIAIVCMVIVSLGVKIFEYKGLESSYIFTSKGFFTYDSLKQIVKTSNIPVFVLTLLIVIALFFMLFSYKKYDLQIKIGKYLSIVLLGFLVAISIFYFVGFVTKEASVQKSFGLGFYLIAIALVMVLLAIFAIKRDQSLIDSLNRIR